jgi:starvation-inducible DNA-binding protein
MINDKQSRPVGGIDKKAAEEISSFLNSTLSNEYALFTKTLNYHWNVTGPRFHSIHNFLEGHYKTLLGVMDTMAERVRILDERPISTVAGMLSESTVHEINGKELSGHEMLHDLFSTHLNIQNAIKSFLDKEADLFRFDPGTEDMLVGMLQQHEEMSWMIKSHLD